ncbi:unnamed protein product, partial [Mesorhabditis spiculigera]
MRFGVVLGDCACCLWILYTIYYSIKYARLLDNFDDLFIISSTVYTSPSPRLSILFLSRRGIVENSRVLLAVQEEHDYERQIQLFAGKDYLPNSGEHLLVGNVPLVDAECKITFSVEQPKPPRLTGVMGRVKLRASTREADHLEHEVVTCSAPIYDGRFPEAITAISTAISHGSFVHIPHGTLQNAFHRVLVTFEKAGHLRLAPWIPLATLGRYDPNILLDEYGREAAFLDCLLLYKTSASFFVFADADEFVVPIREPSYFLELGQRFSKTNAHLLIYNLKSARPPPRDAALSSYKASDLLSKSDFSENTVNQTILVVNGARIREAEKIKQFNPEIGRMYDSEEILNFREEGIGFDTLNKVERALCQVRDDPLFSHAWDILDDYCAFDSYAKEWLCSRGRCVVHRVRRESLYGAFYYNIHQAFRVELKRSNCSEVEE